MKRQIIVLLLVATFMFGQTTMVFAGEPAQRIPYPDVSVNVINPCDNNPVTVTWTDLMLVTRYGQDANGGTHTIFTLEGSIVDTSGNTGQFLFTSHVNGIIPDKYELTEHFTVIGRNADTHQTIVLHDTLHIKYEDGIPTIFISIFDEECRGKPN
jgi:hypothetical protein